MLFVSYLSINAGGFKLLQDFTQNISPETVSLSIYG